VPSPRLRGGGYSKGQSELASSLDAIPSAPALTLALSPFRFAHGERGAAPQLLAILGRARQTASGKQCG